MADMWCRSWMGKGGLVPVGQGDYRAGRRDRIHRGNDFGPRAFELLACTGAVNGFVADHALRGACAGHSGREFHGAPPHAGQKHVVVQLTSPEGEVVQQVRQMLDPSPR